MLTQEQIEQALRGLCAHQQLSVADAILEYHREEGQKAIASVDDFAATHPQLQEHSGDRKALKAKKEKELEEFLEKHAKHLHETVR